jgi:hypothetical protein
MHHLHKLRKRSADLSCRALDELLALRLFAEEKEEWIERASMMRIWITTSNTDAVDKVHSLKDVLDNISANTKNPFSSAATHAAQVVRNILLACLVSLGLIMGSCFGNELTMLILKSNTKPLNLGVVFQITRFLRSVEILIDPRS